MVDGSGFKATLEPLEAYMKDLALLPHRHQTTGESLLLYSGVAPAPQAVLVMVLQCKTPI